MKDKMRILLGLSVSLVLVFAWVLSSSGKPVDPDSVVRLGENYLKAAGQFRADGSHTSQSSPAARSGRAIAGVRELEAGGRLFAYILDLYPQGCIIVSPDTDIHPVIAYSSAGRFSISDAPENIFLHLVKWDMQNRLDALSVTSQNVKTANNHRWTKYLTQAGKFTILAASPGVWGPWLKTRWSQGIAQRQQGYIYPDYGYGDYNRYLPLAHSSEWRCVAGSGPLALAQVLNYWKYPSSMSFGGSDDYTSSASYSMNGQSYNLTVNIDADSAASDFPNFTELNSKLSNIRYYDGDLYFWDAGSWDYRSPVDEDPSLNAATRQEIKEDIAALCFGCGIAMQVDYTPFASPYWSTYTPYHAENYPLLTDRFGYSSASMADVNWPQFYASLEANMKNQQPALLFIDSQSRTQGHILVADGYRDEWQGGSEGYYHLNFGWGDANPDSVSDSWYHLPEGMPQPDTFQKYSVVKVGIIDIEPSQQNPPSNTPPVASNLSIAPSSPTTADSLAASYDYSDADSDPENGSEIRWYKNGVIQSAYNNALTVSSNDITKGDVWYFTVQPNDGNSPGATETSASVTIRNTASVADASGPYAGEVGEDVTFDGSGSSDADGDSPLTYIWSFGDGNGDTTQNATTTYSYNTAGTYIVTLTVSDGSDSSTPDQTSAVITEPMDADLEVSKGVDNLAPNEGETIIYTVTVINKGPDDATNVEITDVLPSGLTYMSDSASQGSYKDNTGLWTLGSLANAASATLAITTTVYIGVVDADTCGVSISNTASVTAVDQGDSNRSNNSDSAVITFVEVSKSTIVPTAGDNGSVEPPDSVTVNCGSDQKFTITPDECYHVADVLVDGAPVGAVTEYTFHDVTSDHTISATFATDTYTIIATAGENGNILPSASVVVNCGSDQAFTISPDECYHMADMLVDGASVLGQLTDSTYTITNVQSGHTIHVTFAIDTHTITATAGENGSISPPGSVTVDCGSDQELAIIPNKYYQVADVLIDGKSVEPVTSYVFSEVASNHTIAVTFEPVPPSIEEIKDDTGDRPQTARDAITITVIQNSGALLAERGEFDIGEKIVGQKLYNDGTHGDVLSDDTIWVGRYEVQQGDDVNSAPVAARLYAFGEVVERWVVDRLTIDTIPPRISDVELSPDPVREPGIITITITFDESGSGIDIDVPLDVNFASQNGDEKPIAVSSFSGTTWQGIGEIEVSDNDGIAAVAIRGGQDRAGNALLPLDTPITFQIDLVEEISWVRHKPDGLLKAGDVLVISMGGETGKATSFDIEGLVSGGQMIETDPGLYKGSYRVKSGDNVVDAVVVCHLENVTERDGITVTVDTTKPEVEFASVEPEIAKAGDVTVSVVFAEEMDRSVEPSVVFVPADSGRTIKLSGKYEDRRTWRGMGIVTKELQNGPVKIVVSGAQDLVGNSMDLHTEAEAFVIDTTPPSSSQASVIIEDGVEFTNDTSLDFTFGGFIDKSGIVEYYYSLTDRSGTDTGASTQELSGKITAGDGEATVYVWAEDRAGNIGDAVHDSIVIDTVLPTVTEATLPELAKARAITVSIRFHDNSSGMSDDLSSIKSEIQLDGGRQKIHLRMKGYSADDLWTGEGEVTHGMNDDNAVLVVSGARDKAGNEMLTNSNYHLAIDTEAPDPPVDVTAIPGMGGTIKLSWEGSGLSDVDSYRIYSDDELLKDKIPASSRSWSDALPDGQYRFGVSTVDKAGNESNRGVTGYVEIDGTSPEPVTNLTSESLPGAIVRLSWNPSRSSDVTTYRIAYDGVMEEQAGRTTWESKKLVDGRSYTFTVTALDEVGNESPGRSIQETAVDNEAPVVIVEEIEDIQRSDVTIEYRLEDREEESLSIICEYRKSVDNRWKPATTNGKMNNIANYNSEITWNSRVDIPSTSGTGVYFRITPQDSRQTGTSDYIYFPLENLLGDYSDDGRIDDEDLVVFQLIWEANDISRELGSKNTDGEPPDLTYAPDDVVDFEDLAVFSLMWIWSEEDGDAAPMQWLIDSEIRQEPTLNVSEDNVSISLRTPGMMGYIALEYDADVIHLSSLEVSKRSNAVFLSDTDYPGRMILAFTHLKPHPGSNSDIAVTAEVDWKENAEETSIVFHYDIRDFANRTIASGSEARGIYQLPEVSALHQNYPNPFNPETWIPFQITRDSDVVIRIYNSLGQLVRLLDLGQRTAGFYTSRERAAYWDGKNASGEDVSSGVYYSSIIANGFTMTRKMVVAR